MRHTTVTSLETNDRRTSRVSLVCSVCPEMSAGHIRMRAVVTLRKRYMSRTSLRGRAPVV